MSFCPSTKVLPNGIVQLLPNRDIRHPTLLKYAQRISSNPWTFKFAQVMEGCATLRRSTSIPSCYSMPDPLGHPGRYIVLSAESGIE
jgi:hypothetical protein